MAVDLLAQGTLPKAWSARWAEQRDLPTLHDPEVGWWTTDDLDIASRRAAAALWRAGVGAGDRVIVSAATSAYLVAAHIAVLRLGAVAVPMNVSYTEREVSHVVNDCLPKLAIVDSNLRADWIHEIDPDIVTMSPHPDDWDKAARRPKPGDTGAGLLDVAEPHDPAIIGYTSGTTGRPKGAVLSHANLLAGAEALRRAWRWGEADRLVLALPLFHLHGLGVGIHGTLLAGASAVLMEQFDPKAVLEAIDAFGCTLLFAVPTMYVRLLEEPDVEALTRLRMCVSGSAPLSVELFERIAMASGRPPLERYGMTETLMLASNPCDGERRAGTVGLPLPGVEMRLASTSEGDEDGEGALDPLQPPEAVTGEVLVRGPNVFSGYWRDARATKAAFDERGWFHTGDIGHLDDHGYLQLVGRAKELIITGGFNVYPREVEEVLARHPGVAEVAVGGVASREWGEEVTAFVVRSQVEPGSGGWVTPEELCELAAAELAPYKRPKSYRFVRELPRNALGKVLRSQLADQADTDNPS